MVKDVALVRVQDVMSRDVVSVGLNDTLHAALELIVENRVSALPVVNGRGQCVGMLSTSDLIDLTHELDDELQNIGRPSDQERSSARNTAWQQPRTRLGTLFSISLNQPKPPSEICWPANRGDEKIWPCAR